MSYHVYSLGEGIVGQVAVTGKHKWIFADRDATNSFSSFEFSDGWQSLFSAGIKTIVVVAVAPYGVIQLGSLNKVFTMNFICPAERARTWLVL
uniref:Transcription factor MYC/MYB N-terminal domain-containing protein n=1 Tax=Rhizophora mucronata TaxID=61149 RepID=A0A2P2KKC9_RHIMU